MNNIGQELFNLFLRKIEINILLTKFKQFYNDLQKVLEIQVIKKQFQLNKSN